MVFFVAFGVVAAACRRAPSVRTELWFGGDVHVGARLPALLDSIPVRKGAVGVVNLEGPIAEGQAATIDGGVVLLRQSPSAPLLLEKAGVRVATVANNHGLDAGEYGRRRTIQALGAQGILTAHDGVVAVVSTPGGVVSVAAFDLTNGLPPDLRATVERSAGIRVVSLHVTTPPSYLPSETLERAVETALAAGARVVVAHGTHDVARVERRGKSIVAWGLGNLVFDCECTTETDGLLLSITTRDDDSLDAAVYPIRAGLRGAPARPSDEPAVMHDLLTSLKSSPLTDDGGWLRF
ncbi:MAG TPA: CapA family protein [Polyangiaceae bacterium]|nr:CapA family protein [Polyangiaceae bacterium]